MKELILGEALEQLIDHRGKTPKKLGSDFTSNGIPVISALLVNNGKLDLSQARFVNEKTFKRWMPIPVKRGDVILTSEAPLGRVARVETDDPLVLGQRLFALRGKPGVLDSGFLFYALQTERVQSDLLGRSTGTTVFGIRQSALRKVGIPAPNLREQRAIAEVLGALDDKIAANERTIETAESLMITLASSALHQTTVAELAHQSTIALKPEQFETQVAHFSLPAFDQGRVPEVTTAGSIKSNKFSLTKPCVLMSKLNPRIPRIWDISKLPDEMAIASTEFVVLIPQEIPSSLLWAALSEHSVSIDLAANVAGTSGSHQRVKPAEILHLKVRDPRNLPPQSRAVVENLGIACQLRRTESVRLTATRDELLPLLMSGKIRVRDAERVVEEVV